MRDTKLLHPIVHDKLHELIDLAKTEGIDTVVTHTLRSKAEQNALFAKGRTSSGRIVTYARYPYSFHNHGVAFDIVPLKDGKPNWSDHKSFNRLGELGKALGFQWGGDWYFVDKAHFQYTQGHSIYEFIRGYKLEEDIDKEKLAELEENLAVKMDLFHKAKDEANEERRKLAEFKGVPVYQYKIVDEKDL